MTKRKRLVQIWTTPKGKKAMRRIAVEEEEQLYKMIEKIAVDYEKKKRKNENARFEFKW